MKHRFLYIMALLLTVAVGARAQSTDPDPIDLTPNADGTEWTLASMPEYDVELEVTYYTDEEVAEMEKIGYYLVGNMNGWTPDSKYKLAENPGASGEYMITLYLDADDEFKIVYSENGTTATTWYPGGIDNNKKIDEEERYTVYFRPNYSGGDDWYYNCIYVASDPLYATPTGNKNEWTLDMPDCDVELEIEYETELALNEVDDNAEKLAEWNGYEADVTLTRKLVAGSWNTLAVPFNVSSQMLGYLTSTYGMQVKELTGTSLENEGKTLMLNFTDAQTIEAGKPYLVKVTSDFDFSAQALPGIKVSQELNPVQTDYADFIPTLGKTTIEGVSADDVLFLAAENTLKNPGTIPTDMKGFRAYFQLKNVPTEARGFALNLGDESTGIESLTASPMGEGSIYTLDGRRIGKAAQKGVYIQNGRKVVIK